VAFGKQHLLQRAVVFDDAVVDDHHLAATVLMRMGVDIAGAAMGGPAGVSDAQRAFGEAILKAGGEGAQLPHALTNNEPAVGT
jgi:hypothetical protein